MLSRCLSLQVFDRVLKENYLLPFDYARIKKILSDVFSLESVESNEVLYLKRKAKVVAQRHRNSFTELYLSNIVHLLADDNSRALRKYRQDPLANPLIFMPGKYIIHRHHAAFMCLFTTFWSISKFCVIFWMPFHEFNS